MSKLNRSLFRSLIVVVLLAAMVQGVFAQTSTPNPTPSATPQWTDTEAEFVGALEVLSATSITVSGTVFDITRAEVEARLAIGDIVKVHATQVGGVWQAREVERTDDSRDDRRAGEFELTGVLTATSTDFIVVAGQPISITGAEINDTLTLGDLVKAHVTLVSGQLIAREVELAGGAAPSCATTTPRGWDNYRVRSGDTLSSIAARTGTTVAELARVNCITDTRFVVAGTLLFVPRFAGSGIGNDNGNDNDDNGNDNDDDRGNDNGNDNDDDRGNDNDDDHGNDNDDDHGNDNDDDHGNDNDDDDDNDNDDDDD